MNLSIKILDERLEALRPLYASPGAAGIDLRACISEPIAVLGSRLDKIPTGIAVAIPQGYVGLIVPRSSKGGQGLALVNTIGVIDSDYRGEILLGLRSWWSASQVCIEPMERVAQMLIVPCPQMDLQFVYELPATERGAGGFGSTGKF